MSGKVERWVEVEIEEFPHIRDAIKDMVEYKFTGRRSLLNKISQYERPEKFLVELFYRYYKEGRSLRELASWIKRKYGIEVKKSALSSLFQRLKERGIHEEILSATSKVKKKIRYYYWDGEKFWSDVDYVQKYIDFKSMKLRRAVLQRYLSIQSKCVEFTGKLPHQWNEQDLINFIRYEYERFKKKLEEGDTYCKGKIEKLTETDLDNIARSNVFSTVVALRSILKYIGRTEFLESVLKTDLWKRFQSTLERLKEYLTPDEIKMVLRSSELSEKEKLVFKLHLTLGCREGWKTKGGIWNLTWDTLYLTSSESPYGYPAGDCYEGKTKGGTWWRGIYLQLFFPELPKELLQYRPDDYHGRKVLESLGFTKSSARRIYRKIEKIIGRRFNPHFTRHTHATLLVKAGVPMQLVAGKPESAFFGVGWEDLSTLYKFYVSLSAWSLQEFKNELAKVRSLLGR